MLLLPLPLRRRLEALAREGYPAEACGVLLGRPENGRVVAAEVTRARNLNRERARDRYELDPEDLLRADVRARELGIDVVGIWHSHPDHPARPSPIDRAAAWEGWSYVIASVDAASVKDLRSWRLRAGEFEEEVLET